MGVLQAVEQALKDADLMLVEVGREFFPVSHANVPERLKAKYIRSVIAAALKQETE